MNYPPNKDDSQPTKVQNCCKKSAILIFTGYGGRRPDRLQPMHSEMESPHERLRRLPKAATGGAGVYTPSITSKLRIDLPRTDSIAGRESGSTRERLN